MIVEDYIVLVVTGSRFLADPGPVASVLSEHVGLKVILYHGDCPSGADFHAHDFAVAHNWKVRRHPARWQRLGMDAGFIRNEEMLISAIQEARATGCKMACLAFPGPRSRGTRDCMRKARVLGVTVLVTKVPE